MSKNELGRVEVLARVKSKQLRVVDAALLLRVSYRQAKRLWKLYREEGAAGLKHRSAGRPSHRAYEAKFRRKVLRLVREKYSGAVGERFGPTLTTEHLESEDDLKVDAETLRRWMLAEGLWSRERKRRQHRQRRARKDHFGELVQMDGSFHAWLEERGPEGCLIDMVDDATNTTWARSWGSKKRSGRRPMPCAHGSSGMGCRWHCTWTGRTCTSGQPRQANVSHEAANVYLRSEYLAEHKSALCACRGEEGRLSPARAARGGTGPDYAVGDGAHGERGLGGALRQSLSATRAAEAELCAGAEQSVGVRGTVREHGDRIPWSPAALARDRRARKAAGSRYTGPQRASVRADFSQETEVGAVGKTSVASSDPPRGAEARLRSGPSQQTGG